MILADGNLGQDYCVTSIDLENNIERRMKALGLTEGTTIRLINRKANGTSILKVRGTRLALGKEIILGIHVNGGVLNERSS